LDGSELGFPDDGDDASCASRELRRFYASQSRRLRWARIARLSQERGFYPPATFLYSGSCAAFSAITGHSGDAAAAAAYESKRAPASATDSGSTEQERDVILADEFDRFIALRGTRSVVSLVSPNPLVGMDNPRVAFRSVAFSSLVPRPRFLVAVRLYRGVNIMLPDAVVSPLRDGDRINA